MSFEWILEHTVLFNEIVGDNLLLVFKPARQSE
jgi:hypothetical protein